MLVVVRWRVESRLHVVLWGVARVGVALWGWDMMRAAVILGVVSLVMICSAGGVGGRNTADLGRGLVCCDD